LGFGVARLTPTYTEAVFEIGSNKLRTRDCLSQPRDWP
jgi:hypothetical protein